MTKKTNNEQPKKQKKVKPTEPGVETLLKRWTRSKLFVYCDAYGEWNWVLDDNDGEHVASSRQSYKQYDDMIVRLEKAFRCKLKVDK